jgi:hypothetical protein
MYVYGTCPKTVVETLIMVELFGIHHKGHKPCVDEQFKFSSTSLYLSFSK